MQETFQLRDVFNPQVINDFAAAIKSNWSDFDEMNFKNEIIPKFPELSYGGRSNLIMEKLREFLPDDYPSAIDILLRSLMPELEIEEISGFERFIVMPQCAFVSRYGRDHYEVSIKALYEMTKRFTAEGDLRTFIELEPERTMAMLHEWSQDSNCHVRRLVSEGARPRLPLGRRLKMFIENPKPLMALLDKLVPEPTLLVRRSIANNLNDVAKDNPDIVVETLERWRHKHPSEEMEWLIKHASRTLIKMGHPGALKLLGFSDGAAVRMENFRVVRPKIKVGDYLEFSFDLISEGKQEQNLAVDFVVYFMKSNGKHASKVFKLTTKTVQPGEKIQLKKRHSFKKIGIRPYYAGEHRVAIQINGKESEALKFWLETNI
ncbi:MAG: DNA alkylation repair protein [Saprospiraceae bacterium]|nr:DNA alkylation repair protein [Saprospiraceae bacterium]